MLIKAKGSGLFLLDSRQESPIGGVHSGGGRASDRGGQVATDGAWDVLERFVRQLQSCEHAAEQIRLSLEAVRDSVAADSVFWYCGATNQLERVGAASVSLEWCRRLCRTLVQDNPGTDSQLLRSTLPPETKEGGRRPHSIMMVRVSQSKCAWIVALRFSPGKHFQSSDAKILNLARRLLVNRRQQAAIYGKLTETLVGMIRCMTTTIEAKDPYTCGHSERVARIAARLGQEMRLSAPVLSDIYLAGLLHDIGKIGIRDSVLHKQQPLTEEELAHIKEHPAIGDRIVAHIKQLDHVRPGVRHHHERYDGRGYPDRLAGEQIPLMARILAVADSCDAMMSVRPYRPAMPIQQIDSILTKGAGTQWDSTIVGNFLACRRELYSICQKGIGESVFVAIERATHMEYGTSSRSSSAPASPSPEIGAG